MVRDWTWGSRYRNRDNARHGDAHGPSPTCLSSALQFLNFHHHKSQPPVLKHQDSRNRLESQEDSMHIPARIGSTSRRKDRREAEELPAPNSPSLVGRLMGLDTLPSIKTTSFHSHLHRSTSFYDFIASSSSQSLPATRRSNVESRSYSSLDTPSEKFLARLSLSSIDDNIARQLKQSTRRFGREITNIEEQDEHRKDSDLRIQIKQMKSSSNISTTKKYDMFFENQDEHRRKLAEISEERIRKSSNAFRIARSDDERAFFRRSRRNFVDNEKKLIESQSRHWRRSRELPRVPSADKKVKATANDRAKFPQSRAQHLPRCGNHVTCEPFLRSNSPSRSNRRFINAADVMVRGLKPTRNGTGGRILTVDFSDLLDIDGLRGIRLTRSACFAREEETGILRAVANDVMESLVKETLSVLMN